MMYVLLPFLSLILALVIAPFAYVFGAKYAGISKKDASGNIKKVTFGTAFIELIIGGIFAVILSSFIGPAVPALQNILPVILLFVFLIVSLKKKFQPSNKQLAIVVGALILGAIVSTIIQMGITAILVS